MHILGKNVIVLLQIQESIDEAHNLLNGELAKCYTVDSGYGFLLIILLHHRFLNFKRIQLLLPQ